MEKVKAFKVFNEDWSCRGFQYEVGKTYTMKETPELCSIGFHACAIPAKCFDYYQFDPKNKVAEVELSGVVVGEESDKYAANKIKIVREISWEEVLRLVNTGIGNSGHRNSGNWNSGDSNSGHWNSGDRNSGDWNSGDWNSGFFNTETPQEILVFDKFCKCEDFVNWDKPNFLYFDLTKWVSKDNMTDQEKKENPKYYITQGYLKTYDYKEAFINSFEKADKEDREKMRNCPNFDAQKFYEISGIDWYLK